MLTVIGNRRGEYRVTDDIGGTGSILAGPFETSSEAWRWIDRQEGQPVSAAEKRAEWVFEQMAKGNGL